MSDYSCMSNRWTMRQDAILRALWTAGEPAAKIADAINFKSRNAIIGRAHRLGLPKRKPGHRKGQQE
jgi:GcrA cell cycle regulator